MRCVSGWRWPVVQTARPVAILLFDIAATAAALGVALLARFEGRVPEPWQRAALVALPVLVGSRLIALLAAKLHHWSFFMSGLSEGLRLVVAMLAGTAVSIAVCSVLLPDGLPRSVWALEFFLATTLAAGMRFGPRVTWAWWGDLVRRRTGAARTIIVGVGGAAEILARDVCRNLAGPYHLIGFVDEHRHASGIRLAGRPILGDLSQLPALIRRHAVTAVLLADPRFPAKTVREVLDMCDRLRVRFKIVPTSFTDVDRRLTAAMLHDLSPADLLPRQEVAFDEGEIQTLAQGRCALVTGAGGSIGGEICRQLARYGTRALVMVDLNENELYLRGRELAEQWPRLSVSIEVADVREPAPLLRLGERYRPDFILHAAAHKHVPLMERAPEEAVKNNVFGTLHAANMARACGAERFVLISTDKAVNPSSVMGASKRVAEMVVSDLGRTSRTHMTSVRFGNVLGSAGSVVPLFKQQIARGGPLTVTHPDCTRYFMTIPEAVGLVLLAGLGGYGELCVLEMGEPMRIADLAKHFITMSGHVPDEEIRIVYTGLREGEKLHEELLTEQEEHTLKVRNRIRVARSAAPPRDFAAQLAALRRLADGGDREGVLRVLRLLVPAFRAGPGASAVRAVGCLAQGGSQTCSAGGPPR
ncbi:MAG: polysaccharide biosynthesis protein, partial [Deltaproteobacteria bacterium]|nr:polysaccharide biosynthesis protein [Deltaproteobacteria bacterium]